MRPMFPFLPKHQRIRLRPDVLIPLTTRLFTKVLHALDVVTERATSGLSPEEVSCCLPCG